MGYGTRQGSGPARELEMCHMAWAAPLSIAIVSASASGRAQDRPAPRVLDRMTVARLAREGAPSVVVAERREEEARALRTGAGVLASTNPELSAYVGPRWRVVGASTDFFIGIAWPFDISGARSQRVDVAADRARFAESETALVRQMAVAEALDLWVRALGADERARVEASRLVSDRATVRAAEVRRSAGTVGDGEVALAKALKAQGEARATTAEHEREAFVDRLRARIGLAAAEPVAIGGPLVQADTVPLDALLSRIRSQPAPLRALAAVRAADSEAALQRRVGIPVPRVTASTGRDPENYAHFGLDMAIPVYQRNQTNVAVTAARAGTAQTEYLGALAVGEAELRAAYEEYEGARDAYRALDAVLPDVEDAEHLATRSYELGQSTLTDLATTRREAAATRSARLDAAIAVARSRVVVANSGWGRKGTNVFRI